MTPAQRAVRALVNASTGPSGDPHVQASVTAVDGSSNATVKWAGETFRAKRNAAYTPAVGDQVLVVFAAGTSPVILCKIV